MKIEIIDDGVGAFATLNKLKYGIVADFAVQILDEHFPLGNLSREQLFELAKTALQNALLRNADAVVFSSGALSMAAAKTLASGCATPVYGCEVPILHAGTYTASQVLVAGDGFVASAAKHFPNVIALDLGEFCALAERGADEREIVAYITENAERYCGKFDCIALGCSCMNLYRHCFSRVFPNAQIFDGSEGVARRLRKKFHKSERKNPRTESTVAVFGEKLQDLSQKYNFFIDEFSATY